MKTLCAGYVRRTVCICIPVPVPRMSGSKALEPCRLCVHYRTKTIAEQSAKAFTDMSRRLFACGSKTALTMMNDRLLNAKPSRAAFINIYLYAYSIYCLLSTTTMNVYMMLHLDFQKH